MKFVRDSRMGEEGQADCCITFYQNFALSCWIFGAMRPILT